MRQKMTGIIPWRHTNIIEYWNTDVGDLARLGSALCQAFRSNPFSHSHVVESDWGYETQKLQLKNIR
jgi:hypothetical protein